MPINNPAWVSVYIKTKLVTETVNNSAVLQDDDELYMPVEPGQDWQIDWYVHIEQTIAGANFRYTFTGPAGSNVSWTGIADDNSNPRADSGWAFSQACQLQIGAGLRTILHIKMIFTNSINAGNIQFQWCQDVAQAGSTRVWYNSNIIGHRLQ